MVDNNKYLQEYLLCFMMVVDFKEDNNNSSLMEIHLVVIHSNSFKIWVLTSLVVDLLVNKVNNSNKIINNKDKDKEE